MTPSGAVRRLFNAFGLHVIRQRQNPEARLLGLAQRQFGSIIDVGANTGQFARRARIHFPGIEMLCFEPLPGPFGELAGWAARTENVRTFNVALGDCNRRMPFFCHADHSPSSSLLHRTDLSVAIYPQTARHESVLVDLRSLDSVLDEVTPKPKVPMLLKLDVQGSEMQVLRGAATAMRKIDACIIEVCLEELYVAQSSFRDIYQFLDAAGFRYKGNLNQVHGEGGQVIYLDAVFSR